MAARSESSFAIRANTEFQSSVLMKYFLARGGSVYASDTEIMDFKYAMVGSEVITSEFDTIIVYYKIDELRESFWVRSEAITEEVGTTRVSSRIDKIGEVFPMRSSLH